ncbi:hypothetical protein [Anaerocolumna jejuensis]|uniref:hypothetical protein n=1 Tax=Anaerocolumna jejuensis TaxID=259063 RepID=UPI003F7C9B6C
MKNRVISLLLAFVLVLEIVGLNPFEINVIVQAASSGNETVYIPEHAYRSGNDIYYSYNMNGNRMGICKINVKTKKITKITDYKFKGKESNGYSEITAAGDSIYCTYDLNYGTDSSQNYIYKISKDGKTKIRLDKGFNPVVYNNRLYYIKVKKVSDNSGFPYDIPVGIYKMNLDGSNITGIFDFDSNQQISKMAITNEKIYYEGYDYKVSKNFWKSMNVDGSNTVNLNSAKFNRIVGSDQQKSGQNMIVSANKGVLYKSKKAGGKKIKLVSFQNGKILDFTVLGDYIMVEGYKKEYSSQYKENLDKAYVYLIKANGKDQTKVVSWWLGE